MAFTKVLPAGISSATNLVIDSINSAGVVTATGIVASTGTFSGNVSIAGVLTYEDVTNVDSIGIITARSGLHVTGGSVGIGTDNPTQKLELLSTGNTIVKLGGASANTTGIIINRGGSEVSRIAHSNSDDLSFYTTSSVTERLRITSSGNIGIGVTNPQTALVVERDWVNNYGSINIKSSSDVLSGVGFRTDGGYAGGFIYRDGTTGNFFELNAQGSREIRALLNGSEALRIDSSGRLLVGTNSDTSGGSTNTSVQIVGNADNKNGELYLCRNDSTIASSNPIGTIEFRSNHGGTYESHARIQVQAEGGIGDGDKPGRIMFFTTPDGTATPTEKLRITSAGAVQIANGNLVFSTSGTGIDFSATADGGTTTPSELLDDYEEGTWTFTITPGGGSYQYNYGQTGHYRKIGSLVFINAWIHVTVSSAVSGGITLSGLPYNCHSTSRNWIPVGGYNHGGPAAASSGLWLVLTNGASTGSLLYNDDQFGTPTNLTAGNLPTSAELYINGCYIAA